jgi:hypothetical protein
MKHSTICTSNHQVNLEEQNMDIEEPEFEIDEYPGVNEPSCNNKEDESSLQALDQSLKSSRKKMSISQIFGIASARDAAKESDEYLVTRVHLRHDMETSQVCYKQYSL